jgi:uncharacterized cofD-like protein
MQRLIALIKWFYPGMRVKRWISLAIAGLCLSLVGIAILNRARPVDALTYANRLVYWLAETLGLPLLSPGVSRGVGTLLLLAGISIIVFAIARFSQSLTTAVNPSAVGNLVDVVYRRRYLAQGPRVVVIGGGTGLSTMLRGIKQYTSNIVAIVTVTDDGGSSGRLTRQLNILPPGDIRNCLVALADSENTMTDLFQYRFRGDGAGEGLRDHAFGNLLIAAMCEISNGDFEEAVLQTSKVLNIRGRVLPSTLEHVRLRAEMEDGSVIEGETSIANSPLKIKRISLSAGGAEALEEAIESILLADVIVIGPGSVYTSVIPNLLVSGIADALYRSRARKVYICNVMTQPGETDGFGASDHIKAIEAHVPRPIFNYVIVNTGIPTLELLNKYRQTGSILVEADTDRIRAMGYRPIAGNFISQTDVVRHDATLLSEAIMRLLI